jgi:hypothetical protein
MFAFPPEFPFVSGRKSEITPTAADVVPEPQLEVVAPPTAAAEHRTVSQAESRVSSAAEARPASPAKPAPPPQSDRRKLKRDALATAALLRVDGFPGPATKIQLTDISVAGARFRCPKPLEIGEKAQIRVEVGPFRWTTRLRVVHCTPLDNGSTSIGCAFQRTELLRPWPAAA